MTKRTYSAFVVRLIVFVFVVCLIALNPYVLRARFQLRDITISYPMRAGQAWVLYIAKAGGYYEKYGLNVHLVFGVHPAGIAMLVSGQAAMAAYPLEQAIQASSKDGSLVSIGSPFRKSSFALMSNKAITDIRGLKGKRIGVSNIGDVPYNHVVRLLAKAGLSARDVEWLIVGTDVNGRASALISQRVDATMLTAPTFFRLEREGYKNLGNIMDYDDIYAPNVYLFKKSTVASNPGLAESLIKAHAEAIKRFYEDKAFALKTYLSYGKQDVADVERIYDYYVKNNAFERVPYILTPAVSYAVDYSASQQTNIDLLRFNFHTVIDNGIVHEMVKKGFFENLFGPGIRAEEERKAAAAF